MKQDFKFSNGEEVRDVVSGFNGIIDCCSVWLNGCIRYSVQPKMKEGETTRPDSLWMDEQSLEKISDGILGKVEPQYTGGPSFASKDKKKDTTK